MVRSRVERKLSTVSTRLRKLREEVRILDEQRIPIATDAEDARLRVLVSETPQAERDHQEAARHLSVVERRRSQVVGEIAGLERTQDDLLDRLISS